MARRWPVAVAAVLIVVVGAGAAAILSFDPASYRDRIVDAVRRATGRELTLAGPLRIQWGLAPVLDAEDVSFANMAGGSRPQMAAAARVEARVNLLALLSRRVEIASVTLVRPDILLETDATGRGNWQFDRPAAAVAGTGSPTSAGPRMTTQLDGLRVESGRVTWHDGVTGRTVVADVPSATLDFAGGPARVLAQAQALGTDIKLDATLGTWAQLTGAAPGPWPVRIAASAGDATVALDGEADPAARSVTGRLGANVPDLARLGALIGRPGLPALRDVHVAAMLMRAGAPPQDISVQVGASDLGSLLPGATLGRLSFNWPAGQAGRLEAEGGALGAPWHVATGVAPAGQTVAFRGLSLASAFGDASGDFAVVLSPRLALRGTLVAGRVDADAIRGALRPRPAAPVAGAPPVSPVPVAAPGPVFSTTPLPWSELRRFDLDLQATAGTVHWGGVDYRNATGHLSLQDGLGQLDPASVITPAGRVDLSASVDARAAAPPVALVVRSAGVSLDAGLRALGLPGGSDALAELDVAVHAAGQSPHALAASLGGHAGVALVDGDLSNAVLGAVLGGLIKQVGAGLDSGGRSHVRCLAVRADAAAGVVTLSALKLDTSRLELTGRGTIDLGAETLSLHLQPLLRVGGAGVSAPLRVEGTLRQPVVSLDPTAAAGRTSVTIGGLAGPPDSCAAELAAARDGRAGRLPAEMAANSKGPKPADLLRSLLR